MGANVNEQQIDAMVLGSCGNGDDVDGTATTMTASRRR